MSEHICVLGMGYIGLPTAIMFCKQGFQTTGVDINLEVIRKLRSGQLHIHEEGLANAFTGVLREGQMSFSPEPVKADVFIIAVPTPFKQDKTADLSYVVEATRSLLPVLAAGNLVILESTSPPRTTLDVVLPILEETGLVCGEDFDLVYSPERVLPGRILEELVSNDRIVGGVTAQAAKRAQDLYASFVLGMIHCTDTTTAEMVKLMENTHRDVNIALANEFSRLADVYGIDIWEAIRLANRHPRVSILQPGPGVGGHCISVDPWFLVEKAPEKAKLIRQAREINDEQPGYLLGLVRSQAGSLKGKRVAVLGLAYKPNIDDMRESPAIEFVRLLLEEGAVVTTFEPYDLSYQVDDRVVPAGNLEEAVRDAEIVVILVGHEDFKGLTADKISQLANPGIIVDAVNLLPENDGKGWQLIRLGDGS